VPREEESLAAKRRVERREWFWRSRRGGLSPVVCEQLRDGRWRLTISNCVVGYVASREAAQAFAARLDSNPKEKE
jgi:hypothetical protein